MASTDHRKTRDFGPTSEATDYDADEDPLVELARIVSEDGGFSSRMAHRAPKAQPAPPAAETTANSSDLEAELLEELETSFPSRAASAASAEPTVAEPEPLAAVEPLPAPRAEPSRPLQAADRRQPAAEDDPDDLLRSIEEQLSQFEQRVRADSFGARFDRESEDDAVDWSGRGGPAELAEDAPVPSPSPSPATEYRFRGPANRDVSRQPREYAALSDEEAEAPVPAAGSGAAAEDVFGRPALGTRAPQVRYAEEADEGVLPGGGEETQADEFYAARNPAPAPEAEAEAPEFSGLEAELTRELGSTYQGYHAGTEQDEDMSRRADMDDEGRGDDDGSGAAAAAVIASGRGMRSSPRPRASAAGSRGRSRKGLVTAAAIVSVVLIGGAAAMYLRSLEQGPSGPPPVIAAPEGPAKIEPAAEEQASAEETVGQSVYDQVAGRSSEAEENVVEGAEEPREIERIVLPQSQGDNDNVLMRPVGSDEAGAEPETETAQQAAAGEEAQGDAGEFGPRRVPTYVVRPDGTIVTTAEAGPAEPEAAAAGLSGQEMAAAQTESMDPKPVQTVAIDEPRTAGSPGLPNAGARQSAPAADAVAPSAAVEEPASPVAQEEPADQAAEAPAQLAEVQPEQVPPEPEPAVEEPQQQVASAPVPPTAPAAASGYLVQLSAQTSAEAAESTFADLQQRYGPILGSLEPNIERADLGDRGIYYRVRVGPWGERAEAVQVCEALQAAGGDCYVTQ